MAVKSSLTAILIRREGMKKTFIGMLALVIVVIGGIFVYVSHKSTEQALYENKDLGIGFLMPEGYKENPYEVEEEVTDTGTIINFLEPESKALVFSLYSMDKNYWDNEVKDTFPISYLELFRDERKVLLYLNVSDVQYDLNDSDQREKYIKLWNLKEQVLESLYFLE